MRWFLSLILVLLVTLAQETQLRRLGFTEALALANQNSAEVSTARVDLERAERDLARLKADPLALRIPLLQGEQALTQAQQALELAVLRLEHEVASGFAAALEADDAVRLAEMQRDISATQLEATTIRFEAGAATTLDVERARNALSDSERALTDARQSRALAYDQLASLLGLSEAFALSVLPPLPDSPELPEVLARLPENQQVVAAEQALALAEAQLAAVDNAFSPRSDIEAARDSVNNAQVRLTETRRSIELLIRQRYNAVLAAQGRVANAEAAYATAQEDFNAQQVRFEAGSISRLDLEQARLSVVNAQTQLTASQHALANALRQLELTVRGGGGAG
jgi:outer membrane protein TolC